MMLIKNKLKITNQLWIIQFLLLKYEVTNEKNEQANNIIKFSYPYTY